MTQRPHDAAAGSPDRRARPTDDPASGATSAEAAGPSDERTDVLGAQDDIPADPPVSPRRQLIEELLVPGVLLAFAAYMVFGIVTMTLPEGTDFPGPRFFPAIIVTVIVALSIAQIAIALRAARTAGADGATASGEAGATTSEETGATASGAAEAPAFDWRSLLWVFGGFVGFAALLNVLGWIIAAGLLFWCVARAFGSRRVLVDLFVGLTVGSIAYIAFDMLLGLTLPSGILGWGF